MLRHIFILWLALAAAAPAQFDVQVRMERDVFLLYESLPVSVVLRNYSGRPLAINTAAESWLQFFITDDAGRQVPAVRALHLDEPLVIGPGQTVTRTVDLLPLYDLRQRGSYRLQGRVTHAGTTRLSPPVTFTIQEGRELWRQVAGLPGSDEYRLYSLIVRRALNEEILYVGVQDPEKKLVYGMLPLGAVLPTGDPQARVDPAGRVHVLYHTQPRSYGYVCVDGRAQFVDRAVYSDLLAKPRLVAAADGTVRVEGGEKTWPRVTSPPPNESPAPAPPAPAKPKKKWWWPFGPNEPRPPKLPAS